MSTYAKVYLACFRCKGTGTETAHYEGEDLMPERPCPYCGGDGVKSIALVTDITDSTDDLQICKRRLKKIMDKLEIGD